VVASDTEGEAFEDFQLDKASAGGIAAPMLPGYHNSDAFEADSEAPRDLAP